MRREYYLREIIECVHRFDRLSIHVVLFYRARKPILSIHKARELVSLESFSPLSLFLLFHRKCLRMKTGKRYSGLAVEEDITFFVLSRPTPRSSLTARAPPSDSTPPILALSEKFYSGYYASASRDVAGFRTLPRSSDRPRCLRVFPSVPPTIPLFAPR
ncbi:hypothetical protein PUN28_012495 [Cardiocondyla obscurior]|uniref:Uncharacterized protein n=1 Tax=Cardiocondyla obscurior TaxID=286306 RepID=A0AAW2FBQ5_9HYME